MKKILYLIPLLLLTGCNIFSLEKENNLEKPITDGVEIEISANGDSKEMLQIKEIIQKEQTENYPEIKSLLDDMELINRVEKDKPENFLNLGTEEWYYSFNKKLSVIYSINENNTTKPIAVLTGNISEYTPEKLNLEKGSIRLMLNLPTDISGVNELGNDSSEIEGDTNIGSDNINIEEDNSNLGLKIETPKEIEENSLPEPETYEELLDIDSQVNLIKTVKQNSPLSLLNSKEEYWYYSIDLEKTFIFNSENNYITSFVGKTIDAQQFQDLRENLELEN